MSARTRRWVQVALLAVLVGTAYAPALKGGFIWDDDAFLTRNVLIRAPDGLRRFWLTREATDYWPMTSTTMWVEWRLWGMDARGYHATNVALHFVEVLLLWSVLRRLGVPGAFLGAALFAVHPVNAESVTWITQRKNLMAMLFYLASARFFLEAEERRPAGPRAAAGWLSASLAAFALAMLSKGSAAMLPVVLAGAIAVRRRPTRADALRLAPFFLVAALLAAVDVVFAHPGVGPPIRTAGLGERALGAGAAVLFYLSKAVLPIGLNFIYPLWKIDPAGLLWWLPLAGCAGLTAILWLGRRRGARPALLAWGYFAVSLAPVMGFTDVYFMRYSLVSDHYQHLALVGIAALGGAACAAWGARWRERGALRIVPAATAAAALALLTAAARAECAAYSDLERLYLRTVARNPRAWMAENNLGDLLLKKIPPNPEQALPHLEAAARMRPDDPLPRRNLGRAHELLGDQRLREGRPEEAGAQYEAALSLDPGLARAHNNLGNLRFGEGRIGDAIDQYEAARRADPGYAEAENNLGVALLAQGRGSEAAPHFEAALKLRPDFSQARANLEKAEAP